MQVSFICLSLFIDFLFHSGYPIYYKQKEVILILTENIVNVIPYIMSQKENLNESQCKIADYIISSPGKIINQTSKEIADTLNLSEATVVRFCQRLGFKGYRDFRLKLAEDQGNNSVIHVPEGINRDDSTIDVVKKVMQIEYEDIKFTLDMINEHIVSEALELITNCNKLAFFGVGSSALVASMAKEHFLHYGKSAYAEFEGLSQIVLANTLGPEDVAFAISISGRSKVPLNAMEVAVRSGAHTICLTQDPSSPLAKMSDCVLQVYRKDHSIDDLGTATRIVHISIIDALAVAYASGDWDRIAQIAASNRKNFKDYLYGY